MLVDTAEFTYTLKTRLLWMLNGIKSWDDTRVKCQVCGKPFTGINAKKVSSYCRKTCCKACERVFAQRSCVEHMRSVHGVENAF